MTARTIQTPAALRRDTRFQACSPGAKWVFGHLCDRREVVAEQGLDVLGTVALIVEGLGDTPREVLAPLLAELEIERGLVTMEPGRLVVHTLETAADRHGPRGGKSNAARQAEYRARRASETSRVTAPVTTQPVTVTAPVTSRDPLLPVESNGCNGANRNVTAEVTADPSRCDESNGSVGETLSPEVPSPHSPLSPTPAHKEQSGAREGGAPPSALDVAKLERLAALEALEAQRQKTEADRAAKATRRTTRKQAATLEDVLPLPGTAAHDVYAAIVADPALSIVEKPGDFATRVTNPRLYRGVDVLAVILDGAEYVSRNPGKYTDGRAFLRGRLAAAAERVARVGTIATRPPVDRRDPQQSGEFDAPDLDDPWIKGLAALPPIPKETARG